MEGDSRVSLLVNSSTHPEEQGSGADFLGLAQPGDRCGVAWGVVFHLADSDRDC